MFVLVSVLSTQAQPHQRTGWEIQVDGTFQAFFL